jgi:hypothetical protein
MVKAKPSEGDRRVVVRADRFELVDSHGRVRAVLGDIGDPDRYTPGLTLCDRHGQERSVFAAAPGGCTLSFVSDGNNRLVLGMEGADYAGGDDDRSYDPTAVVYLMDGSGEPRVMLRVHSDGQSEALTPPTEGADDGRGGDELLEGLLGAARRWLTGRDPGQSS